MTRVMSHIIGTAKKADLQKNSAKQKVWETLIYLIALGMFNNQIVALNSKMVGDSCYRIY